MRLKRVVMLLVSLCCLSSGCTKYWYQEGGTFDQCAADLQECRETLLQYYDMRSVRVGGPEYKFVEACMKKKGYSLVSEGKLPLDVKRQDPPGWYVRGVAGKLEE